MSDEPSAPTHGVFTDIASAISTPPVWIIDSLLPRGLTFMAAPPKAGKSTITLAMAALVADKACKALPRSLSKVNKCGPVLIFSDEASAGELRYVAEHDMGVRLENDNSMLVADDPWMFGLSDPEGVERMQFWLKERDPRLVILDPLRNFHDLEEKDSGIISLVRPLRTWAVEHDAAVLVIHHTKKPVEPGTEYTAHDMRGTSALFGIADGVLMLTPKGKDNEQTHIKATFKRGPAWEKTVTIGAYGREAREEISGNEAKVLELLKNGARSLDDMRLTLKCSKNTVLAACRALELNGQAKVVNGRWSAC